MRREDVSSILAEHQNKLAGFHVESLFLFGSFARDDAGPDSDVDVLVHFTGPPTFDNYMDLKFFLEELFQRKVDLVTKNGLRDELIPYIERDLYPINM